MSLSRSDVDVLLKSEGAAGRRKTPPAAPSAQATGGNMGSSPAETQNLSRILTLPVPVTVVLAERRMAVESALQINIGTIIEFEVPFDSELTFTVADHAIGSGQAVKVGENFGIRITALGSVRQRIDALGGR